MGEAAIGRGMTGEVLVRRYGVSLDVAQALERVLGADGLDELDRWACAVREVDESVGRPEKPLKQVLCEAQCYVGRHWQERWEQEWTDYRSASAPEAVLDQLRRLFLVRAVYERIPSGSGRE